MRSVPFSLVVLTSNYFNYILYFQTGNLFAVTFNLISCVVLDASEHA